MRLLLVWYNDLKIRQKVVLLFLIIALPSLAIGITAFVQANKMVREQAENNISNTLVSLSKTIQNKTGVYTYMMNQTVYNAKYIYILSNDYTSITNLAYDIREYLAPHLSTIKFVNSSISEITIYHEQYIPEYYPYIKNATHFLNEQWYKQSKMNPSACLWDFTRERVYLAQVFPPFLMNRKTAVLTFEFDRKSLIREMMDEISDDFGFVVFSHTDALLYEQHLNDLAWAEADEQIKSGRLLAGHVDIEEIGLSVTIYTKNITMVTVFNVVALTTLMIVISSAVLVFAIRLFSQSLVRPLMLLDGYMKKVEEGNFEAIPPLARRDEIGSISRQFSKMVYEINRLVNEVYNANMKKKEAEITALRSQINPHFLYNSLSAITWRAVFLDNQEIFEIAASLAQFYRTALNGGDSMILVEKEIENIRAYVKLQSIFRENSFVTQWSIQSDVCTYRMLNFLLQPIVENAIVHGIDSRADDKGVLKISVQKQDSHIIFSIEDNGEGIDDSITGNFYKVKGKGYGIKNVEERIKLYYGPEYGITFIAGEEEGVCVIIEIPVQDEPQEGA